jgi:von Willebrand factor type A domain
MDLKLGGNGRLRYGRALALVSLVVAIAIGFAISAERSSARTGPRAILFVVDLSTSMAGKPLTDAQSALKGASPVLPGANVGLRSFGGPCQGPGIERLAIGSFDEPSFNSAVDSLAIGASGTPTPSAIAAAGATLPPGGDRTIVLISDGQSTCGDPCPAAQALKHRLGEGFRIDTVGFRTPDQAEAHLACVARVTGGTYVSVGDRAALQAALAEAAAARVTSLRVSPKSFAAAVRGATVGKVKPKKGKGARVRYTVSESAQVRFTVRRVRVGRRVRGKCLRRTTESRRARRCTRDVRLRGHVVLEAVQGKNRFGLRGRWGGKALRPGGYKLIATAIDASGIPTKAKVARFRIMRR